METQLSRRSVFGILPVAFALPTIAGAQGTQDTQTPGALWPEFPLQNPKLVSEIVGASHGNIERVKEILAISPNYARASHDLGFGDWEAAIGAASHVGNHEIIKLLLDNGARPDIFTFAAMGNLAAVKAMIEANPGIQRTYGPHGIPLLTHAIQGGDRAKATADYLASLGDAGQARTSLPITDAEKERFVGTYRFGTAATDAFVVELSRNKALMMKREGGSQRNLHRVEDNGFAVAGAPQMRIRFQIEGDKAVNLTIHDLAPIVSAKRV